jgi:hypothetical protein
MATLAVACYNIPNSPIKLSFFVITASVLIISLTKPSIFYNQKKLRDFGPGPEETIFPAWMFLLSATYVVYLLSTLGNIHSCVK